ncbi:TIGR03943 family protein [Bacillus mangrovi]|uniref:TIGR03943 family protein n=1 Tax=Metabacillus mangrovi TaxID=1491830 RepID=A0A7X2S7W8_9BACI|nr:TIGR03943 family protein [Metabacillus mangrovi]MTH54441.1 TIGR03943 family protein [Metabacillus mangrovi]
MEEKELKSHLFIRGIILTGFAMLLFKLITTGNIQNFIAPRMLPFMYFAMAVFLILGIMQMWRSGSDKQEKHDCGCGAGHEISKNPFRSGAVYLIFIFPVLTGFMFPEVILDSSAAEKRGFKSGVAASQGDSGSAGDTSLAEAYLEDPEGYMEELDERTKAPGEESKKAREEMLEENPDGIILEDEEIEKAYSKKEAELKKMDVIPFTDEDFIQITNLMDEKPEQYKGKKVKIKGFVYREPGFAESQLAIARFGISCCVADAAVYGMIGEYGEAAKFKKDDWVEAEGTLTHQSFNGKELPVILVTKLKKIDQPETPYVYENY